MGKKIICKSCGKPKDEGYGFWHYKPQDGGGCFSVCKDCATKFIDNKKPSTFLWIMKELDIPFIEERWVDLCRKKYEKDPERFGPASVIGVYIRTMRMKDYADYTYADTLMLNQKSIERRQHELKVRHEMAEKMGVSEDTLVIEDDKNELDSSRDDSAPNFEDAGYEIEDLDADNLKSNLPVTTVQGSVPKITISNQIPTQPVMPEMQSFQSPIGTSVDEQAILNDLTPNDVQYLAMKWGESFKPSEWVKMEEMYQKYCGEFEISVDREAVLISMCKTSINMQRCLDSGDAANASKFSSMFDQLRKSGAFTEAQKKDEKEHYLDSLGELVAAVEREGGVIPKFDYEFEVNPDKVDLTLKDMKSYTYNLVKNEMGLGDLIESYVQKLEQQMEEDKNKRLDEGLVTSAAEEQQIQNDEYADHWLDSLEDSVAADADAFYAQIGDDDNYAEIIQANREGGEE